MRWPYSKGFSFCCWVRLEGYPKNGAMGLFGFLSDNGRGCVAIIGKEMLIYEVITDIHLLLCICYGYGFFKI